MSNLFRLSGSGKLDRKYLRICAVYRLLRKGCLSREQAVSLLKERRVGQEEATVSHWLDAREFRHHWTQAQ